MLNSRAADEFQAETALTEAEQYDMQTHFRQETALTEAEQKYKQSNSRQEQP